VSSYRNHDERPMDMADGLVGDPASGTSSPLATLDDGPRERTEMRKSHFNRVVSGAYVFKLNVCIYEAGQR
jgi:hypothetical protein